MKNLIVNEFMTSLIDEGLTKDQMNSIKNKLCCALENYQVTKISTEVALYNGMPKCYEDYIAAKIIAGLSDGTIKQYELRLRQFFSYVRKDINEITTNDIRVFLYRYQNERDNKVSNRTLDSFRTIICGFFGWANAGGYCEKNPALGIEKIKYTAKQRDYLTEVELEKLRQACITKRETALIEFMYSTGARVSEVCNAKINDIDKFNCEITILGKGNKYRIDYLNPKSIIAIENYISERNDDCPYLFVAERGKKKLNKSGIEKIVNKIWLRSGIEKVVTPHVIRHTTATMGIKRGMPVEQVQKLLGHSNINTTMIYAKVTDESVKRSHSMALI